LRIHSSSAPSTPDRDRDRSGGGGGASRARASSKDSSVASATPGGMTPHIFDSHGNPLSGRDLEDYCRLRGLCPLCAKTKTRKQVFKLFKKKNKWEPLTLIGADGQYEVYKGYCVKPNCFSLDQAKRLAGEAKTANSSSTSTSTSTSGGGGPTRRFSGRKSLLGSAMALRSTASTSSGGGGGTDGHGPGGGRGGDEGHAGMAQRRRSRRASDSSRDPSPEPGPGLGPLFPSTRNVNTPNNNTLNHHHPKSTKKINSTGKSTTNSSTKGGPVTFPPPDLKNLAFATTINSSKETAAGIQIPLLIVQKCVEALSHDSSQVVTTLDLSNIKLRRVDFQALANVLGVQTTLTSLIMENCGMEDGGLEILSQGLCQAKDMPLTKLYLRTNTIGNAGVDFLCQFLESNVTLEKLDLSRNNISTQGGVAIFNAFHRNRLSRIRCLNLSHNEIWDLDEKQFGARALLSKNRTLRVLNLEGNFIHDEGAESLAFGISVNEGTALERLYLGWNGLGDDGTIALAKMLETNTTMRVLGLGGNEIKNDGARALLGAMDVNTNVREISGLWRNKIDRRFIIVAIRRLLLSHEEQARLGGSQRSNMNMSNRSMSGHGASFRSLDEQQQQQRDGSTRQINTEKQAPQSSTLQTIPQEMPMYQEELPTMQQQQQQKQRGKLPSILHHNNRYQEQAPTSNSSLDTPSTLLEDRRVADAVKALDFRDNSRLLDDIDEDPVNDFSTTPPSPPVVESPRKKSGLGVGFAPPPPPIILPPPLPTDEDEMNTVHSSEEHWTKPMEPLVMMESSTPFDRITVFQSAPLAYFDRETSRHVGIPIYDYAYEGKLIQNALAQTIGATIEVSFEPATMDRFSAAFREEHSRVLHLSSFGHTDYLDFENGYGALYPLPMEALSRLISLVGNKLQCVFVASHHAQAIGQAFVNAGVPHVVCCQRDERFRDEIAGEFMTTFYRALANNKVLKQAFEMATEVVRNSPLAKNARRVLDRFCLLPERPDNPYYHNAPVFFAGPVPQRPPAEDLHHMEGMELLPNVPPHFIGREVDMYEIIEALRVDDVIRVGGSPGSGKDSVVSAAARYMLRRKEVFQLDSIFWLPPPQGIVPEEDTLYGDLCQAMNMMKADTKGERWDDDDNLEIRERIGIELEDHKTMLIIDDRGFKERGQREILERFVSHLLNAGSSAKVLIISSRVSDDVSAVSGLSASTGGGTRSTEETTIDIGPLSFKSTALLFGGICKYITSSGCPAAHSAQEFAELLEPPCVAGQGGGPNDKTSQRRFDLFRCMGSGLPLRVVSAAQTMKKRQFIELVGIANRPEVRVDSLGQLDKEIVRLSKQKAKALQEMNFLRASNLEVVLGELENMRHEFPTLENLRSQEQIMKKELAAAVASRHYDLANELKKEMLVLKKRIMKEQRIMPGQTSAAANGQIENIRAQVESLINRPGSPTEGQEHIGFSISVSCGDSRDCLFVISVGNLLEFNHPAPAMGIVCWTNESCELSASPSGEMLIEFGGPQLQEDIAQLQPIANNEWGPTRCGTGNAVIMGPETYGKLDAPCVILSVGPISPSNLDDVEKDDHDTLHFVIAMLRSCYRSSLVLAKHAELQTLGLSLLTTRSTGNVYEKTLRVGLQTLLEEVKFSHLLDLHIITSTPKEAVLLEKIARELGYCPSPSS
jgi:O-acetyl-ADP-ribose deacetylase (regulator of RNase III)